MLLCGDNSFYVENIWRRKIKSRRSDACRTIQHNVDRWMVAGGCGVDCERENFLRKRSVQVAGGGWMEQILLRLLHYDSH